MIPFVLVILAKHASTTSSTFEVEQGLAGADWRQIMLCVSWRFL